MTDNKSLEGVAQAFSFQPHADKIYLLEFSYREMHPDMIKNVLGSLHDAGVPVIAASSSNGKSIRVVGDVSEELKEARTKDIQKISFHTGISVKDLEGFLRSKDEALANKGDE